MRNQALVKKILLAILLSAIVAYASLRLYYLFAGPKIEIYYPKNGELVDPVFTVTGKIQRADKIYLFDREIWTDENGYFKEKMLATSNYTDIIIKASNRWGRENQTKITVENVENKSR